MARYSVFVRKVPNNRATDEQTDKQMGVSVVGLIEVPKIEGKIARVMCKR